MILRNTDDFLKVHLSNQFVSASSPSHLPSPSQKFFPLQMKIYWTITDKLIGTYMSFLPL